MHEDAQRRGRGHGGQPGETLIVEIGKLDPSEERALADEGFDPDEESGGLLRWLQKWYRRQCDGEWKHQYGVRIDTLDNPGWSVKIDLTGTALEGRTVDWVRHEISEADWVYYRLKDDTFDAAGGPTNLVSILRAFRSLVEQSAS